jgi:hypothetical protein
MDPAMIRTPQSPTGGQARARSRGPAKGLMIVGVLAAVAGFVTMNTQLVLAYRGGTLANVHALCSSALVQALNAPGQCSAVNADYTLASVALYGGLVLAGIGLVVLLVRKAA